MAKVSPLLLKALGLKALKHKEGKLSMWGVYGTLSLLSSQVYLQKLLETNLGLKKSRAYFYTVGRHQGKQAFRMLSGRFGYAKTIKDKAKLLKVIATQCEVVGHGQFQWIRIDLKNKLCVLAGRSSLAEEYKKIFGIKKYPVDYFLAGIASMFVEEIIKEKVFCMETACLAMGKRYCEFVIKPVRNWDKKDKQFKEQYVKELQSPEELGAKIKTFIQEY